AGAPGLHRAGRGPERGPAARVGAQAAHPAGEDRAGQAAAGGGVAGAEGSTFGFRPAPRTIARTAKTTAPATIPPASIPSVCETVLMARGSHAHCDAMPAPGVLNQGRKAREMSPPAQVPARPPNTAQEKTLRTAPMVETSRKEPSHDAGLDGCTLLDSRGGADHPHPPARVRPEPGDRA